MTNQGQALWEVAKIKLEDEDRHNLDFAGQDKIDILDRLGEITTEARNVCVSKRWQFASPGQRGEKVVIRDLLEKIATWVQLFVKVGDQLVTYDTGHVALPWAGVRFLLQVCRSGKALWLD
jgi:hypothetical protein